MTIPDWLGSLATLALGAGIYLYGYRQGAASAVPPDPYLRSGGGAKAGTIHVMANTPAGAARFIADLEKMEREAPTTKRAIPGERDEDVS